MSGAQMLTLHVDLAVVPIVVASASPSKHLGIVFTASAFHSILKFKVIEFIYVTRERVTATQKRPNGYQNAL